MNRVWSKKVLAVLCAAWVLVMVLPLFAMSFYAYPSHDDFPNARRVIEAWAQTGSVWAFVKASWEQAMVDYVEWQGTFMAMFLCALQPMIFSMDLNWLTGAVTLLLLAASAWYLVHSLCRHVLKTDGCTAVVLFAALMTALIFAVPGISELLYWHASVQYTFSVIVMMLIAGLLIKLYQPQGTAVRIIRTGILSCLCFVLGSLPYTHALGGAVAMTLVTAWFIRRRSQAWWSGLAGFMAMAVSLVIVIIAPGNAARQATVGDSMNPVLAIVYSIEAAVSATAGWFGPEWLGIALLLVPLCWKPLKESSLRFLNPGWFSFFTFGILAACWVPPVFATGADSWHEPRIEGSLYMLWALLAFLNLLYWTGWMAQKSRHEIRAEVKLWTAAACIGMVVWGAFSTGAAFATPVLGAWKSLLTGEAQQFRREMDARQEAILAAGSLEEARSVIQPVTAQPMLFPLDMLIYQTESLLPGEMHIFFDLQRLVEEYGAGNIPVEEWEALETWSGGEVKYLL